MSHNYYDHNCHGVAVDVFMTMTTRHRWQEVQDFMPDDYKAPPMDVVSPDLSWIELRTIQNMNDHEWEVMREKNYQFVLRFGHLRRRKANARHKAQGWREPAMTFVIKDF